MCVTSNYNDVTKMFPKKRPSKNMCSPTLGIVHALYTNTYSKETLAHASFISHILYFRGASSHNIKIIIVHEIFNLVI